MHLYASEIEWVVMNFISPCVHDCTEDKLIQKSRALQPAYQNDSHVRDELAEELQKAPLSSIQKPYSFMPMRVRRTQVPGGAGTLASMIKC